MDSKSYLSPELRAALEARWGAGNVPAVVMAAAIEAGVPIRVDGGFAREDGLIPVARPADNPESGDSR